TRVVAYQGVGTCGREAVRHIIGCKATGLRIGWGGFRNPRQEASEFLSDRWITDGAGRHHDSDRSVGVEIAGRIGCDKRPPVWSNLKDRCGGGAVYWRISHPHGVIGAVRSGESYRPTSVSRHHR